MVFFFGKNWMLRVSAPFSLTGKIGCSLHHFFYEKIGCSLHHFPLREN